jgi:hypothetical protein
MAPIAQRLALCVLIFSMVIATATGAEKPAAVPNPPGNAPATSSPGPSAPVSWRTLGQVEDQTVNNRVVPKFSPAILALDKREVTLQGFMLPLDAGRKQKHFLLSANVPSCPFCLPGGAESIIEVLCAKPITFTNDPITITGRLSVLQNDPNGLWYRVTAAMPANEKRK